MVYSESGLFVASAMVMSSGLGSGLGFPCDGRLLYSFSMGVGVFLGMGSPGVTLGPKSNVNPDVEGWVCSSDSCGSTGV